MFEFICQNDKTYKANFQPNLSFLHWMFSDVKYIACCEMRFTSFWDFAGYFHKISD